MGLDELAVRVQRAREEATKGESGRVNLLIFRRNGDAVWSTNRSALDAIVPLPLALVQLACGHVEAQARADKLIAVLLERHPTIGHQHAAERRGIVW